MLEEQTWLRRGWGERKGLFTAEDTLKAGYPQSRERLSETRKGKDSVGQGLFFIPGSQRQQELSLSCCFTCLLPAPLGSSQCWGLPAGNEFQQAFLW